MATTPFHAMRARPAFGRRRIMAAPTGDALLFFARCWLVATTIILAWIG